jgi:uncharacterized delta-60 repeat protein
MFSLTVRFRHRGLLLLVALLLFAPVAGSSGLPVCGIPGCLDATFGNGGLAELDLLPGASEFANGIVLQSDGKVVTAGYGSANPFVALVSRVLTDGTLDAGFGAGGVVHLAFTTLAGSQQANSVIVAPDLSGNVDDFDLIVAGTAPAAILNKRSTLTGCAVARLNSDGSFESGFAGGGRMVFMFAANAHAGCESVTLDPFGRIVISGGSGSNVALARLTGDGAFDGSFDADGRLVLSESGRGQSVLVDPSGGIVTGTTTALVRLLDGGGPDNSFGSGGPVVTGITNVWGGLAIDGAGRLLVTGRVVTGVFQTTKPPRSLQTTDGAVAAFLSNGLKDLNFGTNGVALFNVGHNDDATGIALDVVGRILVSAWTWEHDGGPRRQIVARLDPVFGALDTSFGGTGVVADALASTVRPNAGVVVGSAGILLGGQGGGPNEGAARTFVTRYLQ